jgi:hypothetical protein
VLPEFFDDAEVSAEAPAAERSNTADEAVCSLVPPLQLPPSHGYTMPFWDFAHPLC